MEKPDWRIKNNKPYFVHDPEGDGFSYYASIDDRDSFAEDCIREYLDDGWSEDVIYVVSGEITHRATMINKRDKPDLDEFGYDKDGEYWPAEFSFMCDYTMKPLNPNGKE
jgi:hypothetical protein